LEVEHKGGWTVTFRSLRQSNELLQNFGEKLASPCRKTHNERTIDLKRKEEIREKIQK
jgi:hypothetical protein